ncbi:MAG TPA: hypothetical protein VHG93_02280 [Longimicrobium sp.]|nr:hypothetical protein [Longimicrobium sp.]
MRHPPRDLLVLEGEFSGFPPMVEGYAVHALPGWAALGERVRSAAPSAVVLARTGGAGGNAAALVELIRATPSVPVVAAVPFARATAAQVRALLEAGIAEVATTADEVQLAALVPTLRRAHARPLKRRIEQRLPVWMPEDARTLIRAAAATVVDRGGREEFAGIFGVYERTVANKCAEFRLPPPRRLLGWVRVLLALAMLEEPRRTVLNVALTCGYTDNTSLKRAIENFTASPELGSIRDLSFNDAFDRLSDELLRLRHEGRRPGSGARA